MTSQRINEYISSFLSSEFSGHLPVLDTHPVIGAIGTTADHVINNPHFRDNYRKQAIAVKEFITFSTIADLKADSSWTLSLVLSPYKRDVVGICDELTPAAQQTGVVDTLLRTKNLLIGVNTNAFAAGETIFSLVNHLPPHKVLIAGTGASARSVIFGVTRLFGKSDIGIIGRSNEKALQLAEDLGVGKVVNDVKDFGPEVIVNATTVGQTNDTARLDFDIESVFGPGIRFFDINIRVTALQTLAISKGCIIASGSLMQILTNTLRMALFTV